MKKIKLRSTGWRKDVLYAVKEVEDFFGVKLYIFSSFVYHHFLGESNKPIMPVYDIDILYTGSDEDVKKEIQKELDKRYPKFRWTVSSHKEILDWLNIKSNKLTLNFGLLTILETGVRLLNDNFIELLTNDTSITDLKNKKISINRELKKISSKKYVKIATHKMKKIKDKFPTTNKNLGICSNVTVWPKNKLMQVLETKRKYIENKKHFLSSSERQKESFVEYPTKYESWLDYNIENAEDDEFVEFFFNQYRSRFPVGGKDTKTKKILENVTKNKKLTIFFNDLINLKTDKFNRVIIRKEFISEKMGTATIYLK